MKNVIMLVMVVVFILAGCNDNQGDVCDVHVFTPNDIIDNYTPIDINSFGDLNDFNVSPSIIVSFEPHFTSNLCIIGAVTEFTLDINDIKSMSIEELRDFACLVGLLGNITWSYEMIDFYCNKLIPKRFLKGIINEKNHNNINDYGNLNSSIWGRGR